MPGPLAESKLLRTLSLSLVAGLGALIAFVALGAAGVGGPLDSVLAVVAGLAVGLALERALAPPD